MCKKNEVPGAPKINEKNKIQQTAKYDGNADIFSEMQRKAWEFQLSKTLITDCIASFVTYN